MLASPVTIVNTRFCHIATFSVLACTLALPYRAPAEPPSTDPPQANASLAERRARTRYIEDVPFGMGRELDRGDLRRLAEMLNDPEEAESWANIVTLLGQCECRAGFQALAAWERRLPAGPGSPEEYAARLALPMAYGHLARTDLRALARLIQDLRDGPQPTNWTYGHLRAGTLGEILYNRRISALAASGRLEAEGEWEALLQSRGANARARKHIESSRKLHRRVRDEGAERVFRRERGND